MGWTWFDLMALPVEVYGVLVELLQEEVQERERQLAAMDR